MVKKDTIAIWAPLRYTNYGDDLQAILLALYIKSIGYNVIVFQLEKSLSIEYSLTIANSVDELCQNSKICIIAGGALLTPFLYPKRILNKSAAEYELDFKDLCGAIKKYNIKFCAISMGGDGKIRNPYLYYSKHRNSFFKSPNFIEGTVRLSGDILQMNKFKKRFTYYPDILLQTPNFIEIKKSESKNMPIRIGFNLKKGKYLDNSLLNDIFKYAKKNDSIEFYFIKTHMEKSGVNYEYIPSELCHNVKIIQYESPKQLLECVSMLDLLVTSKLHLGLTGLTFGVPFLSYRGPEKARSFVESIGGKWSIISNNISFDELLNNYFLIPKSELYNRFDVELLNNLKEESKQHLEFCKNFLSSVI